jgi:hypothetical protein
VTKPWPPDPRQTVSEKTGAVRTCWRLEQTWSPSERPAALAHREAAPYLVRVLDGRAVIPDHGVRGTDGA